MRRSNPLRGSARPSEVTLAMVRGILRSIGDDPQREGLLETPGRIIKSWNEIFAGYTLDPLEVMKSFEDGACKELVVVKDIEFYSTCEHHMIPFFGRAHVGYVPNGKIIGLSKVARVVDVFARRLQVQERLTGQVADALMQGLGANGVAVVMEAQHLCMMARGVGKQNSTTVTSALRGIFESDQALRSEFMGLIK